MGMTSSGSVPIEEKTCMITSTPCAAMMLATRSKRFCLKPAKLGGTKKQTVAGSIMRASDLEPNPDAPLETDRHYQRTQPREPHQANVSVRSAIPASCIHKRRQQAP